MSEPHPRNRRRESAVDADTTRPNGHRLVSVVEYLPGNEPTDYDTDLSEGDAYRTRFWRCTHCSQERNRRDEFRERCDVGTPPTPLSDGGYDPEDPRTRRALLEDMTVRFGGRGATYEVDSESGATYEVDIAAKTCTCPDHTIRETVCKHLRRVDLDIRAGKVPRPDGTFMK